MIPLRTAYIHVDKPQSDVLPQNAAEERALGLTPRLVIYNALQVPSWGEESGRLTWVKTFQIEEDSADPLRKPMMRATWTFIDSEHIARYSTFVELRNGKILNVLDEQGESRGRVSDELAISLERSPISHGFGTLPVVRLKLDDYLWSGNQAFPKAEESLRLECHRHDYLTSAYPQRTFKRAIKPDDDLGSTFADMDDQELPTGLEYVLELDSFSSERAHRGDP